MGYLYTFIALLCGAVKGYCGKKTSGYVEKYKDAMLVNLIRMLFCVVIGFAILAVQGNVALLKVDLTTLLIALFSGAATSAFVVCWLVSVRKGAYMMLDVFLMLGVLVTLLCSLFFYHEPIRWNSWVGMGILFVAVLIMCSYNMSIKGKMNAASVLVLVVCGLANGLADFSQKMFVKETLGNAAVFNFYTYVFSAIILFVCYCIFSKSASSAGGATANLKGILLYVLIMSVCLFLNSFFKTMAAEYLTSAQLYPLNQGCGLILSSAMSAIFFKEKLTPKCILGLCLSFGALLLINLF